MGKRESGTACSEFWSGRWESNPRPKLGKLLYCHCTTPALRPLYPRIGRRESVANIALLAGILLTGFVAIRWRIGQAAGRRQVANVRDDRPDFVVVEDAVCSGHSCGPESVFDHPEKLTVAVGLHGI